MSNTRFVFCISSPLSRDNRRLRAQLPEGKGRDVGIKHQTPTTILRQGLESSQFTDDDVFDFWSQDGFTKHGSPQDRHNP